MNSKLKTNLFAIASGLMMMYYFFSDAYILSSSIVASLYDVAFAIFIAITVIDFIYKPLNKKTLIFITVFLILSLLLYSNSNRNDLYMMLVIGLAFRDIDVDSFLKKDVIIRILVTLTVIASSLPRTTFDASFFANRQGLGFGHPNSLGMMLTLIALELMYVVRNKKYLSIFSFVLSASFIAFNQIVCRSRTSLMVLAIGLVFFILLRLKVNLMKNKFVQVIIRNLYLICTGVSVVLIRIYESGSQLGNTLNDLFSSRLYLASHYLKLYGINFFGNNPIIDYNSYTDASGTFYFVVDMGYVWIPLIYGILGIILFALIYNLTIKKLFKEEKYHCVVLIILMFVFCFMENTFIRYRFNPFIILLAYGYFCFEEKDNETYLNKYLLTAFIALYVCGALFNYVIGGYGSLLYLKENESFVRYYALLENYWINMHNNSLSLYNWSLGYGSSAYLLIKEGVLSPFNLLLLPFSKQALLQAILYLNIFKIVLLSLFSCLWISRLTKDRFKTIGLSLLICFSGTLVLYWGHGFFDCFVLIPLCLYFVECYIKNNKIIGLIASLIVLFFTNCVYALPLGVLILLYFFIRTDTYKKSFKFVLILLCSMGLTAFILIPTLSLDSSISNPLPINSYSYAISVLLCFSLSIFVLDDNKKKVKYVIGLVLSILFTAYAKKYFGNTLAFIPYFYIVFVLVEALKNDNNKFSLYLIEIILIAVVALISIFVKSSNLDTNIKLGSMIVLSIISIIYVKEYKRDVIAVILAMSCLLSTNIFNKNLTGLTDSGNYSSISAIINEDTSLYRIINDDGANKDVNKNEEYYLLNYAYADTTNNVPGILNNTAYYNPDSKEFIKLFNKSVKANNYIGYSKNEISFYDLLGTKYWFSSDSEKRAPSYFEKVEGEDYYINNYFVELGYINNKTINSDYVTSLSQFEQETVLREYVALDKSDNTSYELALSYDLTLLEDYTYEGQLAHEFEEPVNNVTLVINNGGIPVVDVETYLDDTLVKKEHFYSYDFCNIEVDTPINKIIVNYDDVDGTNDGVRLMMANQNRTLEEQIYEQRSKNCFQNIVFKNDTINANINVDDDNSLVYTYIPYDLNWKVYVDGNLVDILKANYGFIAFNIDKGEHSVQFIYEVNNSYNYISLASAGGIIIIAILSLIKKRK